MNKTTEEKDIFLRYLYSEKDRVKEMSKKYQGELTQEVANNFIEIYKDIINKYKIVSEDLQKQHEKELKEQKEKIVDIQINAFNPPTDEMLGKQIKEMLKKRAIREQYWEGSTLSSDNLYLRIHES